MFYAASPYSPFFTSGLLSSSSTDHNDYSIEDEEIHGLRRGSLPTTGSTYESENDSSYPAPPPRRNVNLYRSFLSLDLAESQSLRSATLKRQAASVLSSDESSSRHSPSPRRPISRMSSYKFDSLLSRSTPPPKPAPSTTLPALPSLLPDPTFVFGSASPRPVLASTQERSYPESISSISTESIHTAIPSSVFTLQRTPKRNSDAATITSSTVSTTYKRSRRADALASLEGRLQAQNFMTMSDDEEDDDLASLDSCSDHEDWLATTPSVYEEEEDRVLPPSPIRPSSFVPTLSLPPKPTHKSSIRRRSTLESWFPLASFMDTEAMKPRPRPQSSAPVSSNYVDKWSSFIEIASLS